MDERISTGVTVKITTAQSRIRSELGNFPSGPTKYTVVHRRPVPTLLAPFLPQSGKTVNAGCRYAYHPARSSSRARPLVIEKCENNNKRTADARKARPTLKRSLSADHLETFQAAPAKRPFPVQIWFNSRKSGPRLPVATALWMDSPLHDSQAFVYTKLLEASQARRYLKLQSKPRKYLHLTGGCIVAINNPPQQKRGVVIPAMTVKVLPIVKPPPIIENPVRTHNINNNKSSSLPPPPPLISLRAPVPKVERPPTPQQDQPLELCKPRKPIDSPIVTSAPSSPLNLAIKTIVTAPSTVRRRLPLPPPFIISKIQSEPLDLASPSPTAVMNRLTLTDSSPKSPTLDTFRRRLLLVLQVLIGKKAMNNLGFPQVSVDEVLVRYLKKASITPGSEVRGNWLKFLRLCMKNEDAWKSEGWDQKSPDDILDEIYLQDVVPILRKSETAPLGENFKFESENERNVT